MKRPTILLTDELDQVLQETARRTHGPRAEIVRDALSQSLRAQSRPWPRSIRVGSNGEPFRALFSCHEDRPPGYADAAVVACAEHNRARVLTFDLRHFMPVAGEGTIDMVVVELA